MLVNLHSLSNKYCMLGRLITTECLKITGGFTRLSCPKCQSTEQTCIDSKLNLHTPSEFNGNECWLLVAAYTQALLRITTQTQ